MGKYINEFNAKEFGVDEANDFFDQLAYLREMEPEYITKKHKKKLSSLYSRLAQLEDWYYRLSEDVVLGLFCSKPNKKFIGWGLEVCRILFQTKNNRVFLQI